VWVVGLAGVGFRRIGCEEIVRCLLDFGDGDFVDDVVFGGFVEGEIF